MSERTVRQRVEDLLAEVEPMLGMHGGSIELVDITPENVVQLRFKGACVGCSAADITLEFGLKEMIMIRIEEVNDVVAVNDEPVTHDAPMSPFTHAQSR
jgi:Fe-S cluster biogenesis protein NfuA